MASNREMVRVYRQAVNELLAVKTDFSATPEERAAATAAIDELNKVWIEDAQARYEARTAALNILIERLNAVSQRLSADPADRVRAGLEKVTKRARAALVDTARTVFKDEVETIDEPDASEEPPPAADEENPSPRAAEEDASEEEAPTPERPALPPPSPSAAERKARSAVPGKLYDDYVRLFESCLLRPDRLAKVNGHVEKLRALRERYEAVGDPLGIPWWFVGAIHGLESGYRFDRHLHNGDPLDRPTRRVPAGRPEGWASASDKSWEASARDALRLMKLDRWSDWSAAGTLYKWELYNGMGYRKYHSDVLSPYLWSFTNHYSSGKYVADGRFDRSAVSRQCGAAAILRALVNAGSDGVVLL